jgi:hypothetical protein
MTNKGPEEQFFSGKDGKQVSVLEYFSKVYNINLRKK